MIYVTGYRGNLGKTLINNSMCFGLDCDIRSKESVRKALKVVQNTEDDILINCAAYTAVDDAELDDNRRVALQTNTAGVANLRDEFRGRIIHISTYFVFDGKNGPYDEKDEPSPINWYGQTKLCGEERLLEFNCTGDVIVRTGNLYGGHRIDFATGLLAKLQSGKEVEVTNALLSNPTHILHLAKGIIKLIELQHCPRIVNIASADVYTKYEFALMIANTFGYDPAMIIPIQHSPGIAKRPKSAGLRTKLATKLGIPIFSVQDGLTQFFLEKRSLYGKEV